MPADRDIVVRHFRQIVLWPIQLMPATPGTHNQRPWEAFERLAPNHGWKELDDEFGPDPEQFQERHYKEFVTFLPYVQRFLYGASVGQEAARRDGEPSIRVFRREHLMRARVSFEEGDPSLLEVMHVDLYFFLDADIAVVALELAADNVPLDRAQDILFRFGRAYPAYWDKQGRAGNCPRLVEWLDAGGRVLAASDYDARSKYLAFVARYRSPCIADHWAYLLQPMALEYPGQTAPLRYRQLEYYRMPFMAYLGVDDPTQLTRADFVRLALVTRPGDAEALPYSSRTLEDFEREYCDDRFWGREGNRFSGDTRIITSGQILAVVGPHNDQFFSGAETGLLGQFRHQYFLLFLIAHFHKAALLSMSDELAVAMNRMELKSTESVKVFKRTIRQMLEIFLRFTHRYWFHEVSNQPMARNLYHRLSRHLGTEELYEEVRHEVIDMSNYLDSDSARRQANTVLRLTVVTIFGLIGTIVSGLLGMNLIDETQSHVAIRVVMFLVVGAITTTLAFLTIARSKQLADFLDTLSDDRVSWREKLGVLSRAIKG